MRPRQPIRRRRQPPHHTRSGLPPGRPADGHGFALTTVVMTSSPCVGVGVGVGAGVGVGDGDSDDGGGDGDGDGKAPCHTVAAGTTGGDPAGTPAGVPAAAAEGGAMPGDVATLDDGIGRARVVGWSALDSVDPPACLLPGLAADAWWCEPLADDIATIMIAAAASTAAAATAAPAWRCRRTRRRQVPRRRVAFGKPSYPNGPARARPVRLPRSPRRPLGRPPFHRS